MRRKITTLMQDALSLPAAATRSGEPLRGVTPQYVPATGVSAKAAALVAAAPAYIKDQKKPFAHPYYWAPFLLIGNPR